jgi:hypothetical protein
MGGIACWASRKIPWSNKSAAITVLTDQKYRKVLRTNRHEKNKQGDVSSKFVAVISFSRDGCLSFFCVSLHRLAEMACIL